MIIERAHGGRCRNASRKCSSQRCPGKIILEIFEKSIDKHKIDAILNAPSFPSGLLEGAVLMGGRGPEDSTEESGISHPDTRCDETRGSLLCACVHGRYAAKEITRLC